MANTAEPAITTPPADVTATTTDTVTAPATETPAPEPEPVQPPTSQETITPTPPEPAPVIEQTPAAPPDNPEPPQAPEPPKVEAIPVPDSKPEPAAAATPSAEPPAPAPTPEPAPPPKPATETAGIPAAVLALTDTELAAAAALFSRKRQAELSRMGNQVRHDRKERHMADIESYLGQHGPTKLPQLVQNLNLRPSAASYYVRELVSQKRIKAEGWAAGRHYFM